MNRAIHPLPRYAFMAWCLVKAQGQIYLYIYLKILVYISVCHHREKVKVGAGAVPNVVGKIKSQLAAGCVFLYYFM
jgi:hypothetical protein